MLCYEERDIIIPDPNDTFYINGKGTYYGFNILPIFTFSWINLWLCINSRVIHFILSYEFAQYILDMDEANIGSMAHTTWEEARRTKDVKILKAHTRSLIQ